MSNLRLFVSFLTIAFSMSCKMRGSDPSFALGIDRIMNLSELPVEDRALVCSQRLFILFVGTAEEPGTFVLLDQNSDEMKNQIKTETKKSAESSMRYFDEDILKAKEDLNRRFSHVETACKDPEVIKLVGERGLGSAFLATVVDGPEWGDSAISTSQFLFDKKGEWEPQPAQSWNIRGEDLYEGISTLELHIPSQINLISEKLKGIANQKLDRKISQDIFLVKGHGGRTTPLFEAEKKLVPSALEGEIFSDISSVLDVTLFGYDTHGPGRDILLSESFIPLYLKKDWCKNSASKECSSRSVEVSDKVQGHPDKGQSALLPYVIDSREELLALQGEASVSFTALPNEPIESRKEQFKQLNVKAIYQLGKAAISDTKYFHLKAAMDPYKEMPILDLKPTATDTPSLFLYDSCYQLPPDKEKITPQFNRAEFNNILDFQDDRVTISNIHPIQKKTVHYEILSPWQLSALTFGFWASKADERRPLAKKFSQKLVNLSVEAVPLLTKDKNISDPSVIYDRLIPKLIYCDFKSRTEPNCAIRSPSLSMDAVDRGRKWAINIEKMLAEYEKPNTDQSLMEKASRIWLTRPAEISIGFSNVFIPNELRLLSILNANLGVEKRASAFNSMKISLVKLARYFLSLNKVHLENYVRDPKSEIFVSEDLMNRLTILGYVIETATAIHMQNAGKAFSRTGTGSLVHIFDAFKSNGSQEYAAVEKFSEKENFLRFALRNKLPFSTASIHVSRLLAWLERDTLDFSNIPTSKDLEARR